MEKDFIILIKISDDTPRPVSYATGNISGPFADVLEATWFASRNPTAEKDHWWYYNSIRKVDENGKWKLNCRY